MKSILQDERKCWFCGSPYVEEHHVFYGTANRQLSERYGLKVWLCNLEHTGSMSGVRKYAVHFNKERDNELKRIAKERFIETYNLNFDRLFYGDGLEETWTR